MATAAIAITLELIKGIGQVFADKVLEEHGIYELDEAISQMLCGEDLLKTCQKWLEEGNKRTSVSESALKAIVNKLERQLRVLLSRLTDTVEALRESGENTSRRKKILTALRAIGDHIGHAATGTVGIEVADIKGITDYVRNTNVELENFILAKES